MGLNPQDFEISLLSCLVFAQREQEVCNHKSVNKKHQVMYAFFFVFVFQEWPQTEVKTFIQ